MGTTIFSEAVPLNYNVQKTKMVRNPLDTQSASVQSNLIWERNA